MMTIGYKHVEEGKEHHWWLLAGGWEGSGEVGKEQRCQSAIWGAREASGGAEVQATLGNV